MRRIKQIFWASGLLTLTLASADLARATFADIDVTHPYFQSIDELQTSGVVEGHEVGDSRMFFPLSKINRAEALKLILLSSSTPAVLGDGSVFSDVNNEDWFSSYVNTAYALNVVEGFPDGNFKPANKVLRAEFIKMLFETLEVPIPEALESEAWYEPYFVVADEYRLLPSAKEPSEELSRGEAAEIIYRTAQVAAGEFERKYTFAGAGLASYYHESLAGGSTASGEPYNPDDLTAAHRTLPLNTRIKVSNEAGEFVVVRINDRGPYHQNRVLDLSRAAFERLAPLGTGVLMVDFELFTEPEDEIKAIPEAIRPLLSEETRRPEVPEAVIEQLRAPQVSSEAPQQKAPELLSNSVMYDQPLFGETAALVATNFFPDIQLRQTFSQTQPQGLVFELAGTSLKKNRFETVTVFMQNQATGTQTQFVGPISGNNFVVPIAFLETGTFDLGIVFDGQRQSRVAEIEVKPYPRERKLPANDITFASPLTINVVPEDGLAKFNWASGENRLTKFVFRQGEDIKNVVFEGGMSNYAFDYEWFDKAFAVDENLQIDLFQALSADGTFFKQRTNWKPVTTKSLKLVRSFPDTERAEISVKPFVRYLRSPQTVTLEGKLLSADYTLFEEAFVTKPDGFVDTTDMNISDDTFNFTFEANQMGRYIVEVIGDQGDILFNRGMFVSREEVLPVMANKQTVVRQSNYVAVYDWINRIRNDQELSTLLSNVDLQNVAQEYAERMANEDFVGHQSPDGSTPATRLEGLNLRSFAENVSYGSNLNLALSGLENSGSHRKNILSSRWLRMGVGLAQNQKGEFYIVQLFAS